MDQFYWRLMLNSKKYLVVKQYDQVDCAPASLLSVLRYYGGDDSFVRLRELCATNVSGSTMLKLVEAAQQLGFKANGATGEYEDLMTEQMPCIAHVVLENQLQHFVVVYKIDNKQVLVGDPGKGLVKLSKNEFLKIWIQKSVVLLKPNSKLHKTTPPKWYNWIIGYLKKEDNWVFQTLFLGVVYTVLGLLTAVFIQLLIDRFIPEGDYSKIAYTGLFLFLLLFIRAFSGYIRQRFSVELNKRISININTEFITRLFKLPKKFFDTRKTGDVTARIHDSIRIQQAMLLITGTTIIDGLIILGSFVFIFQFSVTLAWIALGAVPIYGIILWLNSRKLKLEQNEVMKNYALVESTYIDSLTGIDDIFNFNGASAFTQLNRFIFGNYQSKIENLGLTRSKLGLFAELSGAVITIGVLIAGAFWVLSGNLLLGEMMAAYSLLANMLPSVNRLVDANISLQGASIASQRLLDMLLVEEEPNWGTKEFKLDKSLKISNGVFAWPSGKGLFKKINMNLKKGEISALWGVSGSGKSTLVQIIQRKYDFDGGHVFIDDISADHFDLNSYRKNIGLIPQDIKIFNGTLAENILCGRSLKTIDELNTKINDLGFSAFLSRFEQGLFTLLGEDSRQLSGGEKQIIGLIRALFEVPEALIIDEGFSAIDVDMEAQIFKLIQDYAQTHIVLLISHSLRTIIRADNIYVLQDGAIIQNGTAESLIKNEGYFKRIWQSYQETNRKEIYFG
jgi:ATP-binding cassette subfamily B protein